MAESFIDKIASIFKPKALEPLEEATDTTKAASKSQIILPSNQNSLAALELNEISFKLKCTCPKDPLYSFSCKEGVKWFTNNIIMMKIRRR